MVEEAGIRGECRVAGERRRSAVDLRQVAIAQQIVAVTLRRAVVEEQLTAGVGPLTMLTAEWATLTHEFASLDAQWKTLEQQRLSLQERRRADARTSRRQIDRSSLGQAASAAHE